MSNYLLFHGCSDLTSITSLIKEPFAIDDVFSNSTYNAATLYVPFGTKERYEATVGWNQFQNIEELEPVAQGDVNYDGKIDFADTKTVLRQISAGDNNPVADMNGDGRVDIADVILLLKQIK